MTNENLIAKAIEHAKAAQLEIAALKKPKVRDAVVISFEGKLKNGLAKRRTQIFLDKNTGDFIEANYHDE
jgi:hypothetical protein